MVVTVEMVGMIAGPTLIAVTIVIWFMREMAKLRKDITDHKLFASEHYATKAGLTESLDRVHNSVDRLTSRIDEFIRQMNEK